MKTMTTNDGFVLTKSKNGVCLTEYKGDATEICIPLYVTSIASYTFYGCTGLTSIIIPNSVTSVGNHAFSCCTGLTSITIPDSVTSIGYRAFYGCIGLTSITIPDSVTSVGDYAFEGCTGLTSITIPDSVRSIGNRAFYACTNLKIVTFAKNSQCSSIGSSAFEGCTGLTSITIPDSVTSIGSFAFEGCTGLTDITIPNSVTYIGGSAFYGCTGLTSTRKHYKAFSIYFQHDLVCRDQVFAENEWAPKILDIKLCARGYHFCDNLFEIFNYYSGAIDKDIAIYECDIDEDNILRESTMSKCVTSSINPTKRLYAHDVMKILSGGGMGE